MPHSATQTRPDKRERLIASARELLHRHGVQSTTLAEIAQAADVPPGNVYYYFKTRDELVHAVIEQHAERVRARLRSLEERPTPQARLKALTHAWVDDAPDVIEHGCPLGSLCAELNKLDGELADAAAQLFRIVLAWAERQFRELGRKDARELATTLFAGVQGAALVAATLDDERILTREARRLERWIDSLA
jgi:TetR/AcrR family transcriptional regulator, transcriptional repressor for nem operon